MQSSSSAARSLINRNNVPFRRSSRCDRDRRCRRYCRYTAERLASRGIWLLIADINAKEANQLASELALRYSIRADAFEVDITNEEKVKEMVEAAASLAGRVDYAANCAGVLFEAPRGHASQTTLDVMKRCVLASPTTRSFVEKGI